ncbi:MAG: glycosyltransferase family 2 protein [Verrucomicrobia bacterium]|nr:glycosyltransferase family 2 protein [Verrucomicrobiota bacterium]
MSRVPECSILIISYNTSDLTVACLNSLREQENISNSEIIVFDNASSDDSESKIRALFPEVRLIASKTNLGFARANNEAARLATGRRLLLLNPDTVTLPGSLKTLLEFADQNPSCGIWGGRTIDEHGVPNPSCRGDMTVWSLFCYSVGLTHIFPRTRLFNPESIHLWSSVDAPLDVAVVVGCYLLIDRVLWDRLKGFDPEFFMYGEEVDLCLRARSLGALPRVTPKSVIIHYGAASETSNEQKLIKLFRGKCSLMRKHWTTLNARLGQYLLVLASGIRATAEAFRDSHRLTKHSTSKSRAWTVVFRQRQKWRTGW